MTFGYDASQLMSGMYTQQAFEKIASRLLEELTIDRSQAEEVGDPKDEFTQCSN